MMLKVKPKLSAVVYGPVMLMRTIWSELPAAMGFVSILGIYHFVHVAKV